MPWSSLYAPAVDEPYWVPPSPRKCLAVAADAEVVREHRRAEQVVVAVYGVDAVDQRDLQRGCSGVGVEVVDHVGPRRGGVGCGYRPAAGQQRAEPVGGDVRAGADRRA